MATLGNMKSRSTHAAPRLAHGQSMKKTRDGATRRWARAVATPKTRRASARSPPRRRLARASRRSSTPQRRPGRDRVLVAATAFAARFHRCPRRSARSNHRRHTNPGTAEREPTPVVQQRCEPRDDAFRANRGLVLPLTALTKTRRPSANVSRAATPGDNPPGCVVASTTSAPSRSSRPRRT